MKYKHLYELTNSIYTYVHCAALPRELQEPEHGCDHVAQLRETRATSRLPRHHGPRDGTQLRLTGKNAFNLFAVFCKSVLL